MQEPKWEDSAPVATEEPKWDESSPVQEQQDIPTWEDSTPTAPGSSVARRVVGDTAVSLVKGTASIPQGFAGILDIPTLGLAGKLVDRASQGIYQGARAMLDPLYGVPQAERVTTVQPGKREGVGFEGLQEMIGEGYSPEQRTAFERVGAAKGFIPKVVESVKNPSTIVQGVVESVPSMLAGGQIGKQAGLLVPKLAKKYAPKLAGAGATAAANALTKIAPKIAGAGAGIGEGSMTAGQIAERARAGNESGYLRPGQALAATAGGVLTGVIGQKVGQFAESKGLVDPEFLATGVSRGATKRTAKNVLGGMAVEGTEEFLQSGQEQIMQNLSTGRPMLEGVSDAAAQGLLLGAVMGGGANVLAPRGKQRITPQPTPTTPAQTTTAPQPEDIPTAAMDVEQAVDEDGDIPIAAMDVAEVMPEVLTPKPATMTGTSVPAEPPTAAELGVKFPIVEEPSPAPAAAGPESSRPAVALPQQPVAPDLAQTGALSSVTDKRPPTMPQESSVPSPVQPQGPVAAAPATASPATISPLQTSQSETSTAGRQVSPTVPAPAATPSASPGKKTTGTQSQAPVVAPAPEPIPASSTDTDQRKGGESDAKAPVTAAGQTGSAVAKATPPVTGEVPEHAIYDEIIEVANRYAAIPEAQRTEAQRKFLVAKMHVGRDGGTSNDRAIISNELRDETSVKIPNDLIDPNEHELFWSGLAQYDPRKKKSQPSSTPVQADAKTPELMTPDEWKSVIAESDALTAKENGNPENLTESEYDRNQELSKLLGPKQSGKRILDTYDNHIKQLRSVYGRSALDGGVQHIFNINNAIDKNKPVSAAAVDAYAIKLPTGYVREGDRYVFKPQPAASAPPPAPPTTGKPVAKESTGKTDRTAAKSTGTQPAASNATPDRVQQAAQIIADQATKEDAKIDAKNASKYGQDTVSKRETRTPEQFKEWSQQLVDAIDAKDADTLRDRIATPGWNQGSRIAFEKLTGKRLPLTRKASEIFIDQWAGVTPEERAIRQAAKDADRSDKDSETELKRAGAEASRITVKTETEVVNGKAWVDRAIDSGHNRVIEMQKKGAVKRYALVNDTNNGWPIQTSLLRYARAATSRASPQKSNFATPAPSTTVEPTAQWSLTDLRGKDTGFQIDELRRRGIPTPAIDRLQKIDRGARPAKSTDSANARQDRLEAAVAKDLNDAIAREWDTAAPSTAPVTRDPADTKGVVVETTTTGDKTVSVPSKDKPGLPPKEQKKYLLAEVDKAIAEAPEDIPTQFVSDRDVIDGILAITDAKKKIAAVGPAIELSRKYVSEAHANILKRETSKSGIDMRLTAIRDAIESAGNDALPKVTIEVPGDGEYTLVSGRGPLSDFKAKAEKLFPSKPIAPTTLSAKLGAKVYDKKELVRLMQQRPVLIRQYEIQLANKSYNDVDANKIREAIAEARRLGVKELSAPKPTEPATPGPTAEKAKFLAGEGPSPSADQLKLVNRESGSGDQIPKRGAKKAKRGGGERFMEEGETQGEQDERDSDSETASPVPGRETFNNSTPDGQQRKVQTVVQRDGTYATGIHDGLEKEMDRPPLSTLSRALPPAERARVESELRKMLGDSYAPEWVDGITTPQGREAVGSAQDGMMKLVAGSGLETEAARHEAVHVAENTLFTAEELAAVEAAVPDAEVRANAFIAYKNGGDWRSVLRGQKTWQEATPQVRVGILKSVRDGFSKLWNRMKALFGANRGIEKVYEMYDRLERGALAKRGMDSQAMGEAGQGAERAMERPGAAPVTSEQDAAYLAAVERGDMAEAQRMVDEAAKAAGYEPQTYIHDTPSQKDFSVFRLSDGPSGKAIWVRDPKEEMAVFHHKGATVQNVRSLPVKVKAIFPIGGSDQDWRLDLVPQYGFNKEFPRIVTERDIGIMKSIGRDSAYISDTRTGRMMEVVVFSPSQIKSADPVTYKEDSDTMKRLARALTGNTKNDPRLKSSYEMLKKTRVIPLSDRFNPQSPDIRFMERPSPAAASTATPDSRYTESGRYIQSTPTNPGENITAARMEHLENAAYADGRSPRVLAEIRSRGEAMYRRDRIKTEMDLIEGKIGTGDPDRVAAAHEAVKTASAQEVMTDDPVLERKGIVMRDAYRRLGSDQSDAMQMRKNVYDSRESRLELLAKILSDPDDRMKARMDMIQNDPAALDRMRNQVALQYRNAKRMMRERGKDISKLSVEQIMDDRFFQELMGEAHMVRTNTGDKVHEYWRNAILSAPQTQFVNTLGNLGHGILELTAQRWTEALGGKLASAAGAPTAESIRAMYKEFLPSLLPAARNFLAAWRTERPQTGKVATKLDANTHRAIGGKPGKWIRVPQRLMLATDEFFKSIFLPMLQADHAIRIANVELASGFISQPEHAARVKMLMKPDSKAWNAAYDETINLAFQQQPGRIGSSLSNIVYGSDPRVSFALKFIFPFVKTPANIISTAMRKSPLGSLRFAAKALSGDYAADGRTQGVRDAAEQIIAWTAMLALYGMTKDDEEDGLPRITGSKRNSRGDQGEREFNNRNLPATSIRIGGKWVNYGRLQPFASMISTMVDAVEAWDMAKEGKGTEIPDIAMNTLAANFRDQTFLQTLGDIIDAMQEGGEDKIAMIFNRIVSGFNPNIVRSTIRAFDPYIRDMRNRERGAEWWKTNAERLGQMALPDASIQPPPRQDVYGKPVEREGGAAYNALSPFRVQSANRMTAVDKMLRRYNAAQVNADDRWYPSPAKPPTVQVRGEDRKLTPDEFQQYQKTAGDMASRMLSRARFNYDEPTENDVKRVREVFEKSRRFAHARIELQVRQRVAKEMQRTPAA